MIGRIASVFIGAYIRLVHATSSWSIVGLEHVREMTDRGEGAILAFWHERLLMAPAVRTQTEARVFMLISNHRDGDVIANAVSPFGVEFIRGSAANPKKKFKDKSGASALVQMIAALDGGGIVGVTPDGPRGPARQAGPGVARTAHLTGAHVLPAAYATSRGWRLSTWDRFWVPLPFSRGVYAVEAPLSPPPSSAPEDIKMFNEQLKRAIDRAGDVAEKRVHRSISSGKLR